MHKAVETIINIELDFVEKNPNRPIQASIHDNGYHEAFAIIIKYNLIKIPRLEFPQGSANSITSEGKKVLLMGGIQKYIDHIEGEIKEINQLEKSKLILDVKNAQRIYKTYWWTFSIAIGAFVLAVISLLIQLLKPH
jgi:hypothetical protein